MTRSIFIKDPHFKFGFQVKHRFHFKQDVISKLKQIKEYSELNDVKYCVFTGDVFDESYETKWTFSKFAETGIVLTEYFDDLKIISIPGNHDYFNGYEDFYRIDEDGELKLTVYGEFVRQGLIQDVSTLQSEVDHPLIYQNLMKTPEYFIEQNVSIWGIKYHSDIETVRMKLKELDKYYSEHNPETYRIVILHQNVTPRNVKNITEFTYDELSKFENIDMFVLGHYHVGFETTKVNNTIFINPWNLTRVSRDYEVKMDKHIPNFIDVVFDENKPVELHEIKLEVPSFDEAFKPEYRSLIEATAKDKHDLNIDIDSEFSDTDAELFQKILEKYPELNKPDVVTTVLRYMEQV